MTAVNLLGQPYAGKNVIASGQKAINVYAEINDKTAPSPITYYQFPGCEQFSAPLTAGISRGSYRTSIGTVYSVVGPTVYLVQSNGNMLFVGSIPDRASQVSMYDNGLVVVLVDGSTAGYAIDMATNDFGQIVDPSFYGADVVKFCQTFFVFNRPGTNQFYISLSMVNFAMLTGTAIGGGSITSAGSLYTNGTYQSVPLTGGSGSGATADIVVTGNTVTTVTIDTPGVGYLDGDILSANPANIGDTGSGFAWTVSSIANAFDPLDIAAKAGNADPISTILVIQNNLWLIGELTTEPWIGTGASDFFFQQIQGTFVNHGCIAKYSAASLDVVGFWLMQDQQGKNIIMRTKGYDVEEVSTPYLVSQFNTYETTDDAIGMVLQIEDHAFYILAFPTANITWAMELTTGYWFQLGKWNIATGQFDRYRANNCCFAFGFNLIGDYATGKIYKLNANLATDNGDNMRFIRTFLHMVGPEYQRVIYKNASVNIDPGTSTIPLGEDNPTDEPQIFLSWSDDRGKTFGTPIPQSLGRQGEYLVDAQWNRLGMARDRIFQVEWTGPVITALNGAFVEAKPLRS